MFNLTRSTAAAVVVSSAALYSASSQAALSVEIGTGLTAIQTDALALVDLMWPVVIAISVAFLMFKIYKRGVSKL